VIGKNCVISKNVYIDHTVTIGDNVKIQNNVSVFNGVTVEDNVFIGPNVTFTNDLLPRAHAWDESRRGYTIVKEGASIGAGAVIICGDRVIGKHALVGAGSVITKNVPDHGLAYGNPAKLMGFVCTCGTKLKEKDRGANAVNMICSKCKKNIKVPLKDYVLLK